jgi:hypothetical protein
MYLALSNSSSNVMTSGDLILRRNSSNDEYFSLMPCAARNSNSTHEQNQEADVLEDRSEMAQWIRRYTSQQTAQMMQ